MAKPSDFYVGILTFFAILLPGAAGTAILHELLSSDVLRSAALFPTDGAAGWIAFLVVSYFLGHLIFLAGSYIDTFYNYVRERRAPVHGRECFHMRPTHSRCSER